MPIVPKKPTLLDAYELLSNHPGALGVEAVIDEWHYAITKDGPGYLVFRSPADTIGLSLQRLSFANEDALRHWILEHTLPLEPATKQSEQLPAWAVPLLAEAHKRIMAVINDEASIRFLNPLKWQNEFLITKVAAEVSDALGDLIHAVLVAKESEGDNGERI